MKVKEVLDYIGDVDIIVYHKSCDMSDWELETLISTVEIDDYCICIRSRIPDGYHLKLERQECEVLCCHD